MRFNCNANCPHTFSNTPKNFNYVPSIMLMLILLCRSLISTHKAKLGALILHSLQ